MNHAFPPPRSRARVLSWTALLAWLVLACGPDEPALPEPPRPVNLGDFDARVVARIEDALTKVNADPRRAQSWAELGLVYASERLKSLALDCFRVAARLEPRQPKWPYREAVTLAQIGEFAQAIPAMERSLALEPSYPPSHARLAGYRLALGDLDGAEREFRAATELDSSYPGGWVGLARVALQRDRSAEALEILERLCKEDPEDRTFQQLLANARQQAGGGGELAAEEFLSENEIPVWNDPWELEVRAFREKPAMLQISKLLERGKADEALALLQEERARGTDDGATALQAAKVLQAMGRTQEALREIEAALVREPENSMALLMKANLLDDGGDIAAAVALLERVTTLQPSFGGAFAAKGRKLFELGQHERAVVALQRALELGQGDYELRHALGRCLIVLKRWSEALELYAELVVDDPDVGDAWLELATAQLRGGSLAEAEGSLARARAAGNATPQLLEDVQRAQALARERRARKAGGGAPK